MRRTVVTVILMSMLAGLAAGEAIIIRDPQQDRTVTIAFVDEPVCQGYALTELLRNLPLQGGWEPRSGLVELECESGWCRFLPEYERVLVNNRYVKLPRPVCMAAGEVYVPRAFITLVLVPMFSGNLLWDAATGLLVYQPFMRGVRSVGGKTSVVVLDPGHGGEDRGIAGIALDEKSLVLEMARAIQALAASDSVQVRLTRDGDYDPGWRQRAAQGNHDGVLLFVSIHAHAGPDQEIRVYEAVNPCIETDTSELRQWGGKTDLVVRREAEVAGGMFDQVPRALRGWRVTRQRLPLLVAGHVTAPALMIEVPLPWLEQMGEAGIQQVAAALAGILRRLEDKP